MVRILDVEKSAESRSNTIRFPSGANSGVKSRFAPGKVSRTRPDPSGWTIQIAECFGLQQFDETAISVPSGDQSGSNACRLAGVILATSVLWSPLRYAAATSP